MTKLSAPAFVQFRTRAAKSIVAGDCWEQSLKRDDIWLFVFVALLATIAAIGMFWGYYQHPEFLWRGNASDRNEHFALGVRLALALRNLDPAWFWYELEFAKLWPPFHGLVLSAVLLAGGQVSLVGR